MSTEKATASALARTQIVDGWTIGFTGDDEPRVRDIELGERLGYGRPREIRSLIKTLRKAGKIAPVEVCPTVGRVRGAAPRTGRPADVEFWLTEAECLKISAKAETEQADAILDVIIAVFIAFRRGQLVAALPPPVLDATMVNSARVREDRASMLRLRRGVQRVCALRGYSVQQVHGYIRRSQQVSSPFAIALPLLPAVLAGLELIEFGELSLGPRAHRRLIESAKQLGLFDGEPTKH